MGKTLRVKDVPDELHRILKARAALAGMSLSSYVLHELRGWWSAPRRTSSAGGSRAAVP